MASGLREATKQLHISMLTPAGGGAVREATPTAPGGGGRWAKNRKDAALSHQFSK